MKKDKLIFLSSSDLTAEVNMIKYMTHFHLNEKQNAIKVFSYYETAKQLLNDKIKNYTGLSLFSTDEQELNYTYDFVEEFKKLLRKIDPDWWVDTFDGYLKQAYEYLPPAVKFIITDFNHREAITSELAMKHPIIRIDSTKLPASDYFINKKDFDSLITKQKVFYIKSNHEEILFEKEELNQQLINKISSIFDEINSDD